MWSKVDPRVKGAVEELSQSLGVSLSEYVRHLILDDMERRNLHVRVATSEVR